jgi:hypothetical protein
MWFCATLLQASAVSGPHRRVLSIHLGPKDEKESYVAIIFGKEVEVERVGSLGDEVFIEQLIKERDGEYDVISLEGFHEHLEVYYFYFEIFFNVFY